MRHRHPMAPIVSLLILMTLTVGCTLSSLKPAPATGDPSPTIPTVMATRPTLLPSVTNNRPTATATNSPPAIPPQPTATQPRSGTPVVVATCAPPNGWTDTYTVQAGDTLSAVARRVGTTVEELGSANCLLDANLIHPGQALFIPPGEHPTIVPTAAATLSTSTIHIGEFRAEQNQVGRGGQVTLVYTVTGGRYITISRLDAPTYPGSVLNHDLPPTGSVTTTVPEEITGPVTFYLVAEDSNGRATAEVTVQVVEDDGTGADCLYSYYFGDGGVGCPVGDPTSVYFAYQPFEHGFMLWHSDRDEFYILFDNGAMMTHMGSNLATLPDNPVADAPPPNRVSPVSGFGRIWGNFETIRADLGWALAGEQGYDARVQMVGDSSANDVRFYMDLPDGRVIGISYGTWHFVP